MPDSEQLTGLEGFSGIQKELDHCMKCGMCMSVCPVYGAEKQEAGVARGKIGIAEAVLAGDLELDDQDAALRLLMHLLAFVRIVADPAELRVLEDRDIELRGVFGIAIEPEAGGELLDAGHVCSLLGVQAAALVAG